MIFGITGGTGSGKSFVTGIFEELGFTVIDADRIAKDIMAKDKILINEIAETFGGEYIDENGQVNRKALGTLVFSNREKREVLNNLTHPKIYQEIIRQAKSGGDKVVMDIPLLLGSPLEKLCDVIIATICKKNLRIERIMERDNIDIETAVNRINAQLTDEQYIQGSHFQIYTDGSSECVKKQIEDIVKRYF
ncbi:MAG: dephospho-CoA kinase [Clostridia bacterium]|nr:dephospho-CoA kinase [Clostridia bacterium]